MQNHTNIYNSYIRNCTNHNTTTHTYMIIRPNDITKHYIHTNTDNKPTTN